MEAVIGAVYIDSRENLDVTWRVIKTLLKDFLNLNEWPIDPVRQVYEKVHGVKFEKMESEDGEYRVKAHVSCFLVRKLIPLPQYFI